ncbi:SH3 domain-containing protein, partial [Bacteroides sp. 224]
ESLLSNNYYGYTLLREFCENPMRETPILEKIGTHIKGRVKENNTLLLLEPIANSYDIDIIQPHESLKVYEMGHDNYYLIEVIKPVESPIAGPDGYAIIKDRTETVYGYIEKNKIRTETFEDILQEPRYNDLSKSSRGIIDDPDGYVNIRKETNNQSNIVRKISTDEVFYYWEIAGNWYIVQTEDGKRGFVYKERIKKRVDTGGWVL